MFEEDYNFDGYGDESSLYMQEMLKSIKYLETEGFIRVEYNPKYPGDYTKATCFWKSQKEIDAEVERLCQ